MYFKYFIITLLTFWQFTAFSQNLEKLKTEEVTFESITEENIDSYVTNIYSFVGADIDSLDIKLILNMQLAKAMLIEKMATDGVLTYGDIYDKLLEIKQISNYHELRESVLASAELIKRPADYANWEEDKTLLMKLGIEGEELENIRIYIKEISSTTLTYGEVFDGLQYEKDEAYEDEEVEEAEVRETNKQLMDEVFDNAGLFNEAEALEQSRLENKPILLYFTGYMTVNCRKMEHLILIEPEVAESLLNEFILIPLFVDDRQELPLEEQEEVKIDGKTKKLKTIGAKNAFYQINRFKVDTQPYFVVLDATNIVLGTADYSTKTIPDFLRFLSDSLKKF